MKALRLSAAASSSTRFKRTRRVRDPRDTRPGPDLVLSGLCGRRGSAGFTNCRVQLRCCDELSTSDWSGCLSGRGRGWGGSPETLRETQDELWVRQAGQEEPWRGASRLEH